MPLTLEFEETGAGPPVVILHGLFGASRNWRSVAQALAPQHRVLCVDLRNHGASPWADSMGYLEMAADVQALIARQRLHQPLLVGHSMGGKTAMALALQNPAAIGGLVVVDIAPVAYADRMTPYVQAMAGLDLAGLAGRAVAQSRLAERLAGLLAGRRADPGVVGFLLQNLVSHDGRFDWRLNLAAISAAVPGLSGFPAELRGRQYGGPSMLVYGTQSDYVTPGHAADFVDWFPQSRQIAIAGAGHWLHAEQPAAFIAALQQATGAAT